MDPNYFIMCNYSLDKQCVCGYIFSIDLSKLLLEKTEIIIIIVVVVVVVIIKQ